MFKDHPNCIQLAEHVFVFKNFIKEEDIKTINAIVDNLVKQNNTQEAPDHPLDWYHGKTTPAIKELHPIWEDISELLHPEHVMQPAIVLQIMRPGDDMYVHADSPGMDADEHLQSEDKWSACCSLDYALVAYFGDWEGGEIYYPAIEDENGNKPLVYSPKAGDVVIHRTYSPYEHGVYEVKSGIRAAFSNFMMLKQNNPGSFYDYKTPEYYERIKNLDDWAQPLYENPLFPEGKMVDSESIKQKAEEVRKIREQHRKN